MKSPAHSILSGLIVPVCQVSATSVSQITCRLSEWSLLLYMLKMVVGPVVVSMKIATMSCDSTLSCCHELDNILLLINIAARDFLWMLWCTEGSRGYHLWLAQVLPKKSMYGSWRMRILYMLGSTKLIRSCCVMSDLLRFCCQIFIVAGVCLVALFIKRGDEWRDSVIVLCEA